jgi:hypothetical protein
LFYPAAAPFLACDVLFAVYQPLVVARLGPKVEILMNEHEVSDLSEAVRAEYRSRYPELGDKLAKFDPHLYFRNNQDVAAAAVSSEDLLRHFCEFGHRECRVYAADVTYRALYSEAYPHLADKLRTFDPEAYGRANRDVGGPDSGARDFFEHYCLYGAMELRVVHGDGRTPNRRDAVRQATGISLNRDIIAYVHVFFEAPGWALLPYVRNLSALGGRIELSFSDVTFAPAEMDAYAKAASSEDAPPPGLWVAPSEGRDWGGFFNLWRHSPPGDDSVVFFLHSKKSQHMPAVVGETWRNELLGPICGSYGAVMRAVKELDDGYSMVGSALHRSSNIGPSRDLIDELLPSLGLPSTLEKQEFVAGAMFAVRGKVLNDFFGAIDAAIDFQRHGSNATSVDGSMAHACERLVGYFAASRDKGIAWVI